MAFYAGAATAISWLRIFDRPGGRGALVELGRALRRADGASAVEAAARDRLWRVLDAGVVALPCQPAVEAGEAYQPLVCAWSPTRKTPTAEKPRFPAVR